MPDSRSRKFIGVPIDIVLDDASHTSWLTIKSLEVLWQPLKPKTGIYVVEDTHNQVLDLLVYAIICEHAVIQLNTLALWDDARPTSSGSPSSKSPEIM